MKRSLPSSLGSFLSFEMFYSIYFSFFILLSYGAFGQEHEHEPEPEREPELKRCPVCPDGFTFFPEENKCLRAFTTKLPFDEASENCNALKSHLVFVRDAATNTPLRKVVDSVRESCLNEYVKLPAFWTGGRKQCPNGSQWNWVPINGTLLDMPYTNWHQGEPSTASGDEFCIHFLLDDKLGWNNTPCDFDNCFVCEVDL